MKRRSRLRGRRVLRVVMFVMVIAGAASSADASEILFSRLPACTQFPGLCQPGEAVPRGAPFAGWGSVRSSVLTFTGFMAAEDSLIERIDFWGNFRPDIFLEFWDSATVPFQAPLNPLQSYTFSEGDLDKGFYGVDPNDPDRRSYFLYSAILPAPFHVRAGTTYYLSVAGTGPVYSDWLVGVGSAGYQYSFSQQRYTLASPGGAFVLSGVQVPEPALCALLGLGLGVLGVRHVRRTGRARNEARIPK